MAEEAFRGAKEEFYGPGKRKAAQGMKDARGLFKYLLLGQKTC